MAGGERWDEVFEYRTNKKHKIRNKEVNTAASAEEVIPAAN
jgi:hypothetical protein